MGIWRIKPDDQLPKSYFTEELEYWQITDEKYIDRAEAAEFAELNDLFDEDEEFADETSVFSRFSKVIVAIAIVIGLVVLTMAPVTNNMIDFSVLSHSASLSREEGMDQVKKAIVSIECSGSGGSGFNISSSGLIVTNAHVVDGGGYITVSFPQSDYQVYVVSEYIVIEGLDLALLDIDGDDLPFLELSATYPSVGSQLICIGNPLGYNNTVSTAVFGGILESPEISIMVFQGHISPGSSGSPLLNENYQVVGVVYASLSGDNNMGLAIPVSYILSFLSKNNI